jgi:hypothetical protein
VSPEFALVASVGAIALIVSVYLSVFRYADRKARGKATRALDTALRRAETLPSGEAKADQVGEVLYEGLQALAMVQLLDDPVARQKVATLLASASRSEAQQDAAS